MKTPYTERQAAMLKLAEALAESARCYLEIAKLAARDESIYDVHRAVTRANEAQRRSDKARTFDWLA